MKIYIFAVLVLLTFIQSAHAIDQVSLEQLKKQGFEVKMGELTGAGGRMSLSRLAGFIHPNGIVMKEDCKSIAVLKSSNQEALISDVTKVTVDQSVIEAREFEGFFTFQ